jgi:hypothetical protein
MASNSGIIMSVFCYDRCCRTLLHPRRRYPGAA